MVMNLKQREMKIKPRIKLNYNMNIECNEYYECACRYVRENIIVSQVKPVS